MDMDGRLKLVRLAFEAAAEEFDHAGWVEPWTIRARYPPDLPVIRVTLSGRRVKDVGRDWIFYVETDVDPAKADNLSGVEFMALNACLSLMTYTTCACGFSVRIVLRCGFHKRSSMTHRTKTIEVTAEQFWPEKQPWPAGVVETGGAWSIEGSIQPVEAGDVVAHFPDGVIRVFKPEAFAEYFEEI